MPSSLLGISASPGIVVGPVYLLRWEVPDVPVRIIDESEIPLELDRLDEAFVSAIRRLRDVRDRAASTAGPAEAAIFDVQISILEDGDLRERIRSVVRQKFTAERAFDLVMLEWREHFGRSHHAMMRERVSDLVDVQIRVLSILLGLPDHDPVDVPKGSNAILVTQDLTPSLTVQIDRDRIAGIATDSGTRTSHVAILARSLGLPAVVGLLDATSRLVAGDRVILDGTEGTLIARPNAAQLSSAAARAALENRESEFLSGLAGEEAITTDGVHIALFANVDLPDEAKRGADNGAEGVGLMRTEFLVVGRASLPDEDEQVAAYLKVVRAFEGKPVIIRTFDLGGDKLPVGGYPHEPNPFLGWRAIRMCLDEPEIFKTQLRALLRAAMHGDVRVMLPLVITVDEVRQARFLLAEAARELAARGVPHRAEVPLGVMIETPAAAMCADALAKDVAFFSIGTNDLVQYTLAVDRSNANLATRFTPLHPAVLRLIQRTIQVGAAHGLEVGVCGEMASQPLMAFALIGLGIRQLSVSPRSLARMKQIVRGIHASAAAAAAFAALDAGTAHAAEALLRVRLDAEIKTGALDGSG
ncbi:MAG TPA: phosphoenolpyruvate--protein phosphotransferase [Gemmatimonadaceae bacterium]|nr:phosphoenolpyruvate--protein phosphotransferase [Gemmatimonadaceae bacterium]